MAATAAIACEPKVELFFDCSVFRKIYFGGGCRNAKDGAAHHPVCRFQPSGIPQLYRVAVGGDTRLVHADPRCCAWKKPVVRQAFPSGASDRKRLLKLTPE